MAKKDINDVVAEALTQLMGIKWNDSTLGRKAGVAPNTVKNCRAPKTRAPSAKGNRPSATLTQLSKIAEALGLEVVDLMMPVDSPSERTEYLRWKAMKYFQQHGVLPPWTPEPDSSHESADKGLTSQPKAA